MSEQSAGQNAKPLVALLQGRPLPRRKALLYGAEIARELERQHQQGSTYGPLRSEDIVVGIENSQVRFEPRSEFERRQRSNINDFGIVLFEMATGRPLSKEEAVHLEPSRAVQEVRGELGTFIQDCLTSPPDESRNFGEVATTLEDMLHTRKRFLSGTIAIVVTLALLASSALVVRHEVAFKFKDVILSDRTEPLPSPSPGPPPSAQRLEQLFSAAWLTDFGSSPESVDLSEKAAPFLRVGNDYFLKFALRDHPFPRPSGVEGPANTERISNTPPEALKTGVELEVEYFSFDLNPSQSSTRIRVPPPGESSVVAFRVVPVSIAHEGIRILLRLRFKDLPFHESTLKPVVFGRGETPLEAVRPAVSLAENSTDTDTAKNYPDPQPGDVVITITPVSNLDRSRFGIKIRWEGHRVVNGSVGLKGTELNDKMKSVRKALESINTDFVFKDELNDEDIKAEGIRNQLLLRLAGIGHALYEDLFTDVKVRQILSDIKAYSQSHMPLRVRIEHAADTEDADHPIRMLLPFGLLYDDSDFDPDEPAKSKVSASNFWDYRYLIEFVEDSMLWKKKELCQDGVVRIAAAMDVGTANRATSKDWKSQVDEQKAFLNSPRSNFQVDWVPDEDSFRDLFRKQTGYEHDIIYYYGHSINGSEPSFNLTSGNTLDLAQLKRDIAKNAVGLRTNPLVILNSCRGVAFDGDNYNSFLDVMANAHAAAFIGTEASIGIPFGARIGERLLDRFGSKGSGMTIVRVLWQLKREALDRRSGNPLVLLYSLFGDPLVRVCQ